MSRRDLQLSLHIAVQRKELVSCSRSDIAGLEAQEMGGGLSVTFPFSSATGTADTAAVYMVFEPGGALPEAPTARRSGSSSSKAPSRRPSATKRGSSRLVQLALVPAIAPHSARNIGDGPARILGFFGASTNVAHFSNELAPGVKTLVVGAQPGIALPGAGARARASPRKPAEGSVSATAGVLAGAGEPELSTGDIPENLAPRARCVSCLAVRDFRRPARAAGLYAEYRLTGG